MIEAINTISAQKSEAVWHESMMEAEFPAGTIAVIKEKGAQPIDIVDAEGNRTPLAGGRPQRFVTTDLTADQTNEKGDVVLNHIILMSRFTRQYTLRVVDEAATVKAKQDANEANSTARERGQQTPYTLKEISELIIYKEEKQALFEGQKAFKAILDDTKAEKRGDLTPEEYPEGVTVAAGHLRLASWLKGKKVVSSYDDNNGLGWDVVNRYAKVPSDRIRHYRAIQYFSLVEG